MMRFWLFTLVACTAMVGCVGADETAALAEAGADADTSDPVAHARALLSRTPIFDGHNDLPWEIRASESAPRDVYAYDLRKPVPGHTNLPGAGSDRYGRRGGSGHGGGAHRFDAGRGGWPRN